MKKWICFLMALGVTGLFLPTMASAAGKGAVNGNGGQGKGKGHGPGGVKNSPPPVVDPGGTGGTGGSTQIASQSSGVAQSGIGTPSEAASVERLIRGILEFPGKLGTDPLNDAPGKGLSSLSGLIGKMDVEHSEIEF